MKLQGLKFLESQFNFQVGHMVHVLLYKNTDPAKHTHHTLGLGMWLLNAKECQSIAWNLEMIRQVCEDGETPPEEYDPYYDAIQDVTLDPAECEPIPYDAWHQMYAYMHLANAPYGLENKLSKGTLEAAEILLQGPRTLHRFEDEMGQRMMQRDADDPEGPFRRMTDEERAHHTRKTETAFMEATLFLVDFNSEMERLGEMILSKAPLADILELIGPVPVEEEPLEF